MTQALAVKPRDEATEALVMAKDWKSFDSFKLASLINCTVLQSKVARSTYVLHHPSLRAFRTLSVGSDRLTGCKLNEIISQDRAWLFAALTDGTVSDGQDFINGRKAVIAKLASAPAKKAEPTTTKPINEWEMPKVKTKKTRLIIEEEDGETTLTSWQLVQALKSIGVEVPESAINTVKTETTPEGLKLTWQSKSEFVE